MGFPRCDILKTQRSICFTHWNTDTVDNQANHVIVCAERNIKFVYLHVCIEYLLLLNAFNQGLSLQTIRLNNFQCQLSSKSVWQEYSGAMQADDSRS